jgi:hypothetical protein
MQKSGAREHLNSRAPLSSLNKFLATGRMLAAAADLRQVFRIIAVFTAILIFSGDHAATARMRALLLIAFVCHFSTLLS